MKNIFILCLAMFAFVQAKTQSAEEIVKKHIEAIGGMAKIKAIKSEKMTISMETQGMQFNVVVYNVRPNKTRQEVEFQGKKQIRAFDGKEGWSVNPFSGRETVEKMDADQIKEMTIEADFDGPLVDYKEKGYNLSYEGEEDIDGSPCFHLKLVSKENQVTHYYIDKDTYLLVLQKDKQKMEDGSETESEVAYSNYKEINGTMRAYSMEQRISYQGQKMSTPMKVAEYQLNAEVPEALFATPATPPSGK